MVVTLPTLLVVVALLGLSATFSATEAAVLAVNKVRLRHLMEQGQRRAQLTFQLLKQLDRVIGTLLIANNLVNVGLSAIGSWIFVSWLGPERGLAVATVAITAALLLFGEVAPKMFAATHAELVVFTVVRPLRLLMIVLYPVAVAATWFGRTLLRLLRVPTRRRSPLVTEEEIRVMIQMGREAGVLAESELRLLQRIFEFSDRVVGDAMVPRAEIAYVNLDAKAEEALDVLIEEGHSRVPVCRGSLDDVAGVIYARDVLATIRHSSLFVLGDLIRPVAIVAETKRVAELLGEFQRDKTQIAIVQNAKGRTVGLVTIEDLLEEIVGEIQEDTPQRRASGGA